MTSSEWYALYVLRFGASAINASEALEGEAEFVLDAMRDMKVSSITLAFARLRVEHEVMMCNNYAQGG